MTTQAAFDEASAYAAWVRARDLAEKIPWGEDVLLKIDESEIRKRGEICIIGDPINLHTAEPEQPSLDNPAVIAGLAYGAQHFHLRVGRAEDPLPWQGKVIMEFIFSWSNLSLLNADITIFQVLDRANGVNLPRTSLSEAFKMIDQGISADHVAYAYRLDHLPEFRFIRRPLYREGEEYTNQLEEYREKAADLLYKLWQRQRR